MTRIVDIENVFSDISETYSESTYFDISYTVDDTNYQILSTTDFLAEISMNYFEMSYISHTAKENDVTTFAQMWELYKKRHADEWLKVFNAEIAEIDPAGDYSETRIITPNINVSSTTTYGRTSTNSGGISTTISHGRVTTGQTNTYDGTLRDSVKSTESGTTGNSSTDTTKNTLGGSDGNITRTQGNTTETKTGYKNNPYDNMQKSIEFAARFNLRDMIISDFTKECLFYDNGNGGGDLWHLPLI